MIDYARVGRLIKMHRTIFNWSIKQLAFAANLDVKTVRDIERGKNTDYDSIDAVCRALGADTQYTLNPDNPAARELYLAKLYSDEDYINRLDRVKNMIINDPDRFFNTK